MQRILFVDDHPAMLSLLQQVAQAEGYACLLAGSGEEALRLMRKEHVDAVVLDVMMPGMDGMEVCRAIRTHSDVPILMLTARTEERDCIEGFNMGADDYVTKPFSPRELMVRIRALLRRAGKPERRVLQVGELVLDPFAHRTTLCGAELKLTKKEEGLLEILMRTPGKVFTREELLDRLWTDTVELNDRAVDTQVRRLRAKLEEIPHEHVALTTVWGLGYKVEEKP